MENKKISFQKAVDLTTRSLIDYDLAYEEQGIFFSELECNYGRNYNFEEAINDFLSEYDNEADIEDIRDLLSEKLSDYYVDEDFKDEELRDLESVFVDILNEIETDNDYEEIMQIYIIDRNFNRHNANKYGLKTAHHPKLNLNFLLVDFCGSSWDDVNASQIELTDSFEYFA